MFVSSILIVLYDIPTCHGLEIHGTVSERLKYIHPYVDRSLPLLPVYIFHLNTQNGNIYGDLSRKTIQFLVAERTEAGLERLS